MHSSQHPRSTHPQPTLPEPPLSDPTLATPRGLAAAALTLLLPVYCALCGERDFALCPPCSTALQRARLTPSEMLRPVSVPFPVFATTEYTGVVRDAIIAYKEQQRSDLRRPLGDLLALSVLEARRALAGETLHVVTIPSASRRTAERGFDHVTALLRRVRPRPRGHRWLRASTSRRDQVGLDAAQRADNAAEGFTVPRRHQRAGTLLGARVLLIDDLATTGSTLQAASDALARHGATVLAAAVVAHTPKLSGNLQRQRVAFNTQ